MPDPSLSCEGQSVSNTVPRLHPDGPCNGSPPARDKLRGSELRLGGIPMRTTVLNK
jgi:hypothetical protein